MRVPTLFVTVLVLAVAPFLQGLAGCGDKAPLTPGELQQQKACVDYLVTYNSGNDPGALDQAESRCDICLEYNERSAECLNGMGLVWLYRGNDDQARDYFKMAIRENNDFAEARNNLGTLEFTQGNFQKAESYFEQAIEIDPRYQDGRYNLALSRLRLGQEIMSSSYQREAAAVSSRGEKFDENKIYLNIAEGNRSNILEWFEEAEVEYRKMFELFPTHTQSYHDMGVINMQRGALEKLESKQRIWHQDAESFFVRCLDLEPTFEMCHANYGHLLLVNARYDESLFHFVQCLAANRVNPICNDELRHAYAGSQLQSESLQKYMEQLADNPGYAPGHYGFCIALFDKGLTEMAVTECENALKLDNTLCLANYRLGLHYKKVLDKDLAIANCRALIGCAEDERYEDEVLECKEIVQLLEIQ